MEQEEEKEDGRRRPDVHICSEDCEVILEDKLQVFGLDELKRR